MWNYVNGPITRNQVCLGLDLINVNFLYSETISSPGLTKYVSGK